MTTEIAVGGGPDEFDWRVSRADVAQSGDFSLFPGIDRILVLTDGGEMALALPDRTEVLALDEPFSFDGALPIGCTVDRPARDLNVMTRRGAATANLTVWNRAASDDPTVVGAADHVVLVVLEGTVDLSGGTDATLAAGDVAVGAEQVSLTGSARVAAAQITLS